eukprot:838128-Amphidinium_carterae.1
MQRRRPTIQKFRHVGHQIKRCKPRGLLLLPLTTGFFWGHELLWHGVVCSGTQGLPLKGANHQPCWVAGRLISSLTLYDAPTP